MAGWGGGWLYLLRGYGHRVKKYPALGHVPVDLARDATVLDVDGQLFPATLMVVLRSQR